MNNVPTTEERIWAVISHLSALAFGMGLLLPVIGWSEQRQKSKYASFQCLQALGYQSLGYTVWLLSYLVLMVVFLIMMVIMVGIFGEGGRNIDVFTGVWTTVFLAVILISLGTYLILPVIAAVSCALGRDYRYPVMGNRLARYLGYDPAVENDGSTMLIEEHEDRWVSSMGHISVIIPLWGILPPLTAWILQGKRSLFLKFQSVQTVVYQGLVNVLYMSSGVVYFIGFAVFLALTGFESGPGQPSQTGIIGLIVLGVTMLFAMFIILLLPLLHILGQWAGYRVLKGDDYRYPLVGKLVERWVSKKAPVEVSG